MTKKILCFFALSVCLVQAVHVRDYDKGVLKRSQATSFFSDEARSVRIKKTNPFSMQSENGLVSLDGKGWIFESPTIYPYNLDRVDHRNIEQSKILTILGCYNGKRYNFEFIKHKQDRTDHLRVIAVNPFLRGYFNLCPFCNRELP